jgi:sugar phosphate isomerase/epimerase
VHIKDVLEGKHVLPGDGELPIREIIEYMTARGYDGYFSLEWEKYWRRELPEIEEALDKLFSLF